MIKKLFALAQGVESLVNSYAEDVDELKIRVTKIGIRLDRLKGVIKSKKEFFKELAGFGERGNKP